MAKLVKLEADEYLSGSYGGFGFGPGGLSKFLPSEVYAEKSPFHMKAFSFVRQWCGVDQSDDLDPCALFNVELQRLQEVILALLPEIRSRGVEDLGRLESELEAVRDVLVGYESVVWKATYPKTPGWQKIYG